jgi:hypothetical protein
MLIFLTEEQAEVACAALIEWASYVKAYEARPDDHDQLKAKNERLIQAIKVIEEAIEVEQAESFS